MPLLQLIGMLLFAATVAGTMLSLVLFLRGRRARWGVVALLFPVAYAAVLVVVALGAGHQVVPPGAPLRFCGFYLDCHLSATVVGVKRTPSAWTVRLRVANDARRVALAPRGLRVELIRGDSVVELPLDDPAVPDTPIPAGEAREVTVAFAAPADGVTPALRVSEGAGVDRVIEWWLLGDDDALGRGRVRLGL